MAGWEVVSLLLWLWGWLRGVLDGEERHRHRHGLDRSSRFIAMVLWSLLVVVVLALAVAWRMWLFFRRATPTLSFAASSLGSSGFDPAAANNDTDTTAAATRAMLYGGGVGSAGFLRCYSGDSPEFDRGDWDCGFSDLVFDLAYIPVVFDSPTRISASSFHSADDFDDVCFSSSSLSTIKPPRDTTTTTTSSTTMILGGEDDNNTLGGASGGGGEGRTNSSSSSHSAPVCHVSY